jgi:hypothetical protein
MPRFRNRREQDRRGLDDTSRAGRAGRTEPWRGVERLSNSRHARYGIIPMRHRVHWDPNAPRHLGRTTAPAWLSGALILAAPFVALLIGFLLFGVFEDGVSGGLEVVALFVGFLAVAIGLGLLIAAKILALSFVLSLPGRAVRGARRRRGAR